jgi:hypothetical protein
MKLSNLRIAPGEKCGQSLADTKAHHGCYPGDEQLPAASAPEEMEGRGIKGCHNEREDE